ncbi:DNA polymerase III PolC-type [Nautilia profundicola AmH]|uniref:DNA polymerase III PolC-type n=1 Tax=Nautilia profundicola (strain ATCC BAA-1463 / DSM 18972 / AmH) TaxID=598659 RepID=B9L5N4_NAUPA|nr:3'-5' exonuclease [Nautilia profundicola]ACM93430.1 DNA polymerase III PolC-type [Nautilia profundicola AmH]
MKKKFIEKLKTGLTKEEFLKYISELYPDFSFENAVDFLKFQGLPLTVQDDIVILKTAITPYDEFEYCVVDIEVNNSKPNIGQVIEIGAVKIKNLKIVDTFEFLIYAKDVPKYVERVTGINQEMLKNEASQKEILRKFRLFLGESVFVAHAADFDYNFLAHQFEKENLGEILNRFLCTLTLSQKTLEAERYGLKYLMEELKLPEETHHRALGDAKTTARIFLMCLENLPDNIITTEDLIEFAAPTKNKCKKKKNKN